MGNEGRKIQVAHSSNSHDKRNDGSAKTTVDKPYIHTVLHIYWFVANTRNH
jgi:hypothetical protein